MKRRKFLTEGLFGAAALLGAAAWSGLQRSGPEPVAWRKVKPSPTPEVCRLGGDVAAPLPVQTPMRPDGGVAPGRGSR